MASEQVKCNKPGCPQLFPSEKEMKSHKYHDPTHHYCRKCDYDAKDWDDLLDHKVESMAPFLIGARRHEKHKKMKHLCCEFCGEDFKSLEGRMAHRKEMHQAPQNVICAGSGVVWDEDLEKPILETCGQVFLRASDLVAHFEKGRCPFVDSSQFHAERQHKHVVKQIMANPDIFTGNICASKAMAEVDLFPELPSVAESDATSSASGGVALLDDDSASEISFDSLVPRMRQANLLEQDIDDQGAPITRATHETWPRLPVGETYDRLMSAGSSSKHTSRSPSVAPSGSSSSRSGGASLVDFSEDGGDNSNWETGSARSASTVRRVSPSPGQGRSVLRKNTMSVRAFVASLCGDEDDDYEQPAPSVRSRTTAPSERIDWTALTRARLADTVAGGPTVPCATTSAQRAAAAAQQKTNLFNSKWYDPHSASYNPDLFWHSLLQQYKCPFAGCDARFPASDQVGMETHLRYRHVLASPTCPTCRRAFRTVAGLVRHFEASLRGSKCWIAGTSEFARVVDNVTGGFLSVGRGAGRRANALSGWRRAKGGAGAKESAGRVALVRVTAEEAEMLGGAGVKHVQFSGEVPELWEGKDLDSAVERRSAFSGAETRQVRIEW